MLIKIIALFLLTFVQSRCSDKDGSFILNIQIHLDEITAMKILAVETVTGISSGTKTDRQKLVGYLDGIFNNLNKDLANVGVQLKGEYSNLIFEELELGFQMEKLCNTKLMAIQATARMLTKLAYPNTEGLGLRIVALSCMLFDPVQIPFFALPAGGCGNLGTIFVIEPFTLKSQIKYLVKMFISEGMGAIFPINSGTFKKHLCHFVNKCAVKNDRFGKFEEYLENVDFNTEDDMPIQKSNSRNRNLRKNKTN